MSPIIHLTVSMLAVIYMNLGFKKRYLFIIVMIILGNVAYFLTRKK